MMTRHRPNPAVAFLLAAAAVLALSASAPARADSGYDGYQQLIDHEAREALAAGDLHKAWALFARLVDVDPDDGRALREIGRIAHALGKYEQSASILERASELRGHPPDPELHYMRGEALLALGREAEANRELAMAEAQIGDNPTNRMHILWRARIASLRGEVDAAQRWYASILPDNVWSTEYEQITLLRVEAYIHNDRWGAAEALLREFLVARPDHSRGRQMLAWVLENRGDLDQELPLRASLAEEWGEHAVKVVSYARALERSGQDRDALAQYRHAKSIADVEVDADVDRLETRLAPEIAAGAGLRNDPTGTVSTLFAGVNTPVVSRFRAVATAEAYATDTDTTTAGSAWGLWTTTGGSVAGLGATGWQDVSGDFQGAAALVWRTNPARRWQLYVRGEANAPWRESAATFEERGTVDTAEVQAYASPLSRKLVFAASGRARRMGLGAVDGGDREHATQLFGAVGFDWVIASRPGQTARGEFFYDDMVWPSSVSDALILSYRHYEMTSDTPFGQRLVLVDRSRIDEISGVARYVFTDDGELSGELRGGYGLDRARSSDHWRAGATLLLSLTPRSRAALSFDALTETTSGLVGRRETGSLFLHVDL